VVAQKAIAANDYFLTSEELVRTLEIVLLLLCASTVIVTGVNVLDLAEPGLEGKNLFVRCSEIRAFAWLSSGKLDPFAKTGRLAA